MKKIFQFSMAAFLFSFTIACSNAPEGEKVNAEESTAEAAPTPTAAKSYSIDIDKSFANWTGTKPTGKHVGVIKLMKGELSVKDGNVTSGIFVFDMNSIVCTDLEGDDKADLEGHLKSPDFFDVANYSEGLFEVTAIKLGSTTEGATHEVTGNLTLKGISKSVTLPANINVGGEMASIVTPAFTINRTEWDIKYKSSMIGTLADKVINDEIGLVLQLVAVANPAQ